MTRARLVERVLQKNLTVLLALGVWSGCAVDERGVQPAAVSSAGGAGNVSPADGVAASGGAPGSSGGSGGASGSAGTPASEAGAGSGGTSASGGTSGAAAGSGGASVSGGTSASEAGARSGGASASGGTSGSEASAGSGGSSASGGTSGSEAGAGSGGTSASGGTSGSEAGAGSGGSSAAGGTSGTDAAAGSGGTSASAGASGTDAATGAGGTSASGGRSGSDAGSSLNDGASSDGRSGNDAAIDSVAGPSWHLIWSDEFNLGANSGADTTKWNVATWEPNTVNGEQQKYMAGPQNVFHDGLGHLVLRGLHDSSNNAVYQYTSGRLQTDGKFQFAFGRVEVRAKLPAGRGSFPAILLMGTAGNWPQCGEIGMMEQWGQDKSWLYCSTYSGAPSDINTQVTFPSATTLSSDFHVYALEWYSDRMVFFIDGVQVARSNFDTTSPFYTGTYYLILDVAIGGSMGGNIDDAGGFPMDMVLDYVRVYSQ